MEELIKWKRVTSRPLKEEELEIYIGKYVWDGVTPEEGETVLVSDGKTVWVDTWVCYSRYDWWFDGGTNLEKFYWSSIPKRPIREVE